MPWFNGQTIDPKILLTVSIFVLILFAIFWIIKKILYLPPLNIFEAVSEYRYDHIRKYLSEGGDINKKNHEGLTPLMIACAKGVRLLGDKVRDHFENGAYLETLKMIKFLLEEAQALPDIRDNEGNPALHYTVTCLPERGHLLLAAGANINLQNDLGETALIQAAMRGQTDVIKLYLEYGADTEIRDNTGRTARLYAMDRGFTDIVELLPSTTETYFLS